MFSSRYRVSERGVHHDNAMCGRCFHIHVIDADTCAADYFQFLCGFKYLRRYFRSGADGEAIIFTDNLQQLFFIQSGLGVDLNAARFEDIDSLWAEFIGNKNFRHRGAPEHEIGSPLSGAKPSKLQLKLVFEIVMFDLAIRQGHVGDEMRSAYNTENRQVCDRRIDVRH